MKKFNKFILVSIFLLLAQFCFSQDCFLIKCSGDKQLGIRGVELKQEFVVRLLNSNKQPVKNAEITFYVAEDFDSVHVKNISYFKTPHLVFTDDDGYAKSKLIVGKNSSDKFNVIVSANNLVSSPIAFSVSVLNKNWLLIMIIGLFGGTALLLFGMFKINSAFQKVASKNIKIILTKFTSTRLKGFFTGLFVTSLNQSSSATLLLQVTLASAGILTFFQSMSVTIGASVGSTVTGQLVAFRLVDYALFIIAIGYFIYFFSSKKTISAIGESIFGFGMLFYGMKIMSDSILPLTLNNEILSFIASVQSPILSILVGALFTLIIQSSGATVGITIVLASSGILSFMQSICICLGSQIGTSIGTALIATINQTRNGKRVVIWHLFYQCLGVVLVFPFIAMFNYNNEPMWNYFVKFFTEKFVFSSDIARQIAMSHTLVTLFSALLVLPVIPIFYKIITKIYPNAKKENRFSVEFIDKKYIKDVDKALELSEKEIIRLSIIIYEILSESIKALKTKRNIVREKIVYKCLQVQELTNRIVPYLTEVGQNKLTTKQSKEEVILLYMLADLEQVSDIIHRNLMYVSRQKITKLLRFSQEGLNDIKNLHRIVNSNCLKIINYLLTNDISNLNDIVKQKHKFQLMVHNLKKKHIARLQSGLQESIETSGLHIEVLEQYMKINDIFLDISNTIINNN